MKRIISLILLAFIYHVNTLAGVLCGTILNETNNLPVQGVVIWLENTNYIDTTDINGKFLLADIPTGTYTIIIEHSNYIQKAIPDFLITEITTAECVTDCNGVPGGNAYTDSCGNCVGGLTGLEPCIISGISDESLKRIKIYYNSTNQYLYINNAPKGNTTVYDIAGQPVFNASINQENLELFMPNLNRGVYIAVFTSKSGKYYSLKFIF